MMVRENGKKEWPHDFLLSILLRDTKSKKFTVSKILFCKSSSGKLSILITNDNEAR